MFDLFRDVTEEKWIPNNQVTRRCCIIVSNRDPSTQLGIWTSWKSLPNNHTAMGYNTVFTRESSTVKELNHLSRFPT